MRLGSSLKQVKNGPFDYTQIFWLACKHYILNLWSVFGGATKLSITIKNVAPNITTSTIRLSIIILSVVVPVC